MALTRLLASKPLQRRRRLPTRSSVTCSVCILRAVRRHLEQLADRQPQQTSTSTAPLSSASSRSPSSASRTLHQEVTLSASPRWLVSPSLLEPRSTPLPSTVSFRVRRSSRPALLTRLPFFSYRGLHRGSGTRARSYLEHQGELYISPSLSAGSLTLLPSLRSPPSAPPSSAPTSSTTRPSSPLTPPTQAPPSPPTTCAGW